MGEIHHIVAATDFSAPSEHATKTAVLLAKRLAAKITVVHVLEPGPPLSTATFPYPILVAVEPGVVAKEQLKEVVLRAKAEHRDSAGALRDGVAWKEIVAAADELGADVIVMGAQGRGGAPEGALGSVAERVTQTSRVPVLPLSIMPPRPRSSPSP